MFARHVLTDGDTERIGEAVFSVLERVGLMCQNADLLRAVAGAGAHVDEQGERATFPRAIQREFVEGLRKEAARRTAASSSSPKGTDPASKPFPRLHPPIVSLQVAPFYHDDEARQRRPGNRTDFITLAKFGEALHGPAGVGHALTLTDVPPLVEPLEAALLLAEHVTRPRACFAWHADQTDYLIEMGEILGLKGWYSHGSTCFAHPLRFDRDSAAKAARELPRAESAGLTAMPIVGVTAPVTAAGFVAVSAAEFLALWMLARAVRPDLALEGNSIWAGTMDMRTGEVSYSAPDALFYGCAVSEFLRRWAGVDVHVGGGEYCSAKMPGLYAALEKAQKAMTIAAFTGRHPAIGEGMVDNGKVISPVQLLLDREMTLASGFLARRVESGDDALALDTALEVGFGLEGGFLEAEHTRAHYRECLWMPEFADRSGWNGFAHEEEVLARVRRRVRELLSSYRVPERDPDVLERLRAVVARARRHLLR